MYIANTLKQKITVKLNKSLFYKVSGLNPDPNFFINSPNELQFNM